MHEEMKAFLESLEGTLLSVRQIAERILDEDSCVDPLSGSLLISRRTSIAPEAYGLVLFPGIDAELIARYETVHGKKGTYEFSVPSEYKQILKHLNGADLFQISLFGIPRTMANDPPLLDRSRRQPLDLATANRSWNAKYKPRADQFHIGSGPYSPSENLGYFLNLDRTVEARRVGGECFATWQSIASFLSSELSRAESQYRAHEEFWRELNSKSKKPKRSKSR
jgi:hypothetical protein